MRFWHKILILFNKVLNLAISYKSTVDKEGIRPCSFSTKSSSNPSDYLRLGGIIVKNA